MRINDAVNQRHSHDGWALFDQNDRPLMWTFCTTRQELRELIKGRQLNDMLTRYKPRKAKMVVVPA